MTKQKRIRYEELKDAELEIDALYEKKKGGNTLLSELIEVEDLSGFRVKPVKDKKKEGIEIDRYAYIALVISGNNIEWPDNIDITSGILRYYGDNHNPGKGLHETPKHGNEILCKVFSALEDKEERRKIPPFPVFEKTEDGNMIFRGIAVPGTNDQNSPDKDLIAIWRSKKGLRFQNYEAHFTIIDTGNCNHLKKWLKARCNGDPNSEGLAPEAWKRFIKKGRIGIIPLVDTSTVREIPKKEDQLPEIGTKEDKMLELIRKHYPTPTNFEKCAVKIVRMLDPNFQIKELTRRTSDGGRDAIGKYKIGSDDGDCNLYFDCYLEAKRYNRDNGVGVKETSRLISRLKQHDFGVIVTTSYIGDQAYKEIIEDNHKILIITGKDIVNVLLRNNIDEKNIEQWLKDVDEDDSIRIGG